jgi:hypothetical protein
MPVRHFHDFILVADAAQTAAGRLVSFEVRVFDSPVGQGTRKEGVRIPDGLARQLRLLEVRELDKDLSGQIQAGETLAALLLPSYARQMFSASLARLREDEGLRLILRLDPATSDLPWEYIYLASGPRDAAGFVALDPRVSIVRHEALDLEADWFPVGGDWFEAPAARRVVVAMATPGPHDQYPRLENLPREQAAIRAALNEAGGIESTFLPESLQAVQPASQRATQGDELPGVTIRLLSDALMNRADVFHFSGHGEFADAVTGSDAALVFSDDRNQALPVSGAQVAAMLRGKGVRLVVLGACLTGRRDGRNVWTGVAAQMLRAGIPAVVAMQFTIDDSLAAAFCGTFYRALVAGLTVDEAVGLGRTAIRAASLEHGGDPRDWGVPVLYVRTPGGRVFNPVANPELAKAAAEKSESLFKQSARRIGETGRLIGPVVANMTSGSIRVEQKVTEETRGFVIGTAVFNMDGGHLTVEQVLGDVTGDVVAAEITNFGGSAFGEHAPPTETSADALAGLEKLLRAWHKS